MRISSKCFWSDHPSTRALESSYFERCEGVNRRAIFRSTFVNNEASTPKVRISIERKSPCPSPGYFSDSVSIPPLAPYHTHTCPKNSPTDDKRRNIHLLARFPHPTPAVSLLSTFSLSPFFFAHSLFANPHPSFLLITFSCSTFTIVKHYPSLPYLCIVSPPSPPPCHSLSFIVPTMSQSLPFTATYVHNTNTNTTAPIRVRVSWEPAPVKDTTQEARPRTIGPQYIETQRPKVIIVGAGIAGLSLGLLLQMAGIEFRILERVTEFDHAGTVPKTHTSLLPLIPSFFLSLLPPFSILCNPVVLICLTIFEPRSC